MEGGDVVTLVSNKSETVGCIHTDGEDWEKGFYWEGDMSRGSIRSCFYYEGSTNKGDNGK